MRSGPIVPVKVEQPLDRRDEVLALWEQGSASTVALPWLEAEPSVAREVAARVAGARVVVLVVGETESSRRLLDATLDALSSPVTRLYVYGDVRLETDAIRMRRIASLSDQVLVRLGHRPPADWLIVDGEASGLLMVGSHAGQRTWAIPVDGSLARSLFAAFRALFWFHAMREALPDARGVVAFRTPLAAPFAPPGTDISLPAGRLRLDGLALDRVAEAEIRISPRLADPGRARIIVMPPVDTYPVPKTARPVSLTVPAALAQRGHSVVWTDMGLPSMTLTRERVIMDLVEAPIALRLEWPRNVAIDLAHRIERALLQPEWTYYSQRRLRDIKGSVLLDEATEAKDVVPSVSLNVGDVPAPLLAFDVSPARMPSAPPLALEVIYRWRRVPQTAPKEAGKARIVQDWMRLDEWMRARGDALRGELDGLDKQTGLLSRLRRWLPSWDDAVNARRRLRDELDEIGEVAPSQVPAAASDRVTLLMGVAGRMEHLRREAHDNRQTAEDAEAQDAQRAAWQARIDDAKKALSAARAEMAAAEKAGAAAVASEESAQSAIDAHIAAWRVARAAELARETITLEEALSAARVQREALNAPEPVESGEAASTDPQIASEGQQGKPGKNKKDKKGQKGKTGAGEDRREAEDPAKARYDADRRIKQAQQAVERNQREREAIAAQSPPAAELRAVTGAFVEARQATERCKAVMDRLAGEIRKHEGAAAEAFRFAPPARLASLQTLDAGPRPPPVPTEALPELGELLEHHGQRFLALRTWEQVKQAKPVADRLRAELVVDASHLKRSMA